MKGSYILLLILDSDKNIEIGKLGNINFKKGFYAYVGSALGMGGFKRVERHFNIARGKILTRKWHIDYLLAQSNVDRAILIPTKEKIECILSKNLNDINDVQGIAGFGCSDCYCKSHLYYTENDMKNKIIEICNNFGKIIIKNY